MAGSYGLYGIKACDTMKKARLWLEAHGVAYVFHDYKKEGLAPDVLEGWVSQVGWECLLNRAGTTFRKLLPEQKEGLTREKAVALMLEQLSMIRRPVLVLGSEVVCVGFRVEDYERKLSG